MAGNSGEIGFKLIAPDNAVEMQMLETDSGANLGYGRVVGRRRTDAQLAELALSTPAHYEKKAAAARPTNRCIGRGMGSPEAIGRVQLAAL